MSSQTKYFWYDRGYVPHCAEPELTQFITFRLQDSLPSYVVARLSKEDPDTTSSHGEQFNRLNQLLDRAYGSCILREPVIAQEVVSSILHHDRKSYKLIAWVVMPNHVHLLIKLLPNIHLAKVVHSLKSFTAHRINKVLRRSGTVWFREYFDRYIRSEEHLYFTKNYIEQNPVMAGLCKHPENFPWSSAGHGR